VDPELRETETDLLFTARLRTGRSLLLYVLLEHQSTVDRWMALRMLRYVVRQLEHWRQEHPESPTGAPGTWPESCRNGRPSSPRCRRPRRPGVVIRYLLWIGDQSVQEATGRVLHSVLDEQRAEELMRSYGEELMERGRQQGLARGRAETLLRLLAARGLHVDDANRQRILDCTDVATLDRWFDQALHATTLSEVLDGVTQ
jgi:predicted transposase YdaD